MQRGQRQSGFTIIELLIVIVVISILAAITIVAYTGVQERAKASAAEAKVAQALKQVKSFASLNNEAYPASVTGCPSPSSTQLCIEADADTTLAYSVENSVSPQSFCFSISNTNSAYYTDETGSVLPGSCTQQSCYEIQQGGGSRGMGTYWIQPTGVAAPIRAYCDMNTSGGGWTLLVNTVGPRSAWANSSEILSKNQAEPSLTENYSILRYANDIKANLPGSSLRYRYEANDTGRWGGVFEAPYSTNLEGTTAQSPSILIEQYDAGSWSIDTTADGNNAPSAVPPWIGVHGLKTWWGSGGSWWGTIIAYSSAGGSWQVAPWIGGALENPTVIRYWVR